MPHEAITAASDPSRRAGRTMLGRTLGHPPTAFAVLAGLTFTATAGGLLLAQRPLRPAAPGDAGTAGQLWVSATPLDDHRQLLLVVDPQIKTAAIYHVDAAQGTLTLKSTRDITWDLMVGDFNAQEPKPSALKKMLQVGPEAGPIGQNAP